MKTHNLFYYTTIILESEDLFPGLDSSVFNDTKPKEEEDYNSLGAKEQKIRALLIARERYLNNMIDELAQNDAFITGARGNPDELVWYDRFHWLDKYPTIAKQLRGYRIDKNSPLFKDIEDKVRKLEKHSVQTKAIGKKLQDIAAEKNVIVLRNRRAL